MPEATPEQRRALAAAVNDRIKELRNRTNEEIRDRGRHGPSTTTISNIRNAKGTTPSEKSLARLDDGLEWVDGSSFDLLWFGTAPRVESSTPAGLTLDAERRNSLLGALRNIRQSADEAVKILGG